jgi:casein kinase II subunit beta
MLSGILRSSSSSSEESDSSLSDVSSSYSWISWFVSQPGNEFFLEIDDDYIRDNFNLYGLRPLFQYYDHALELILDPEGPDEEDLQDRDYIEMNRESAELYGLIHARFILSPRGLSMLKERYLAGDFGTCPRLHCNNHRCLPVGSDDEIRKSFVRVLCPLCEQVYAPRIPHRSGGPIKLDSAFFGTSLPHMFLQAYPDLVPTHRPVPYVAKIFGFRVHSHKSVVAEKMRNESAGIRQPRPYQPLQNGAKDLDSDESV